MKLYMKKVLFIVIMLCAIFASIFIYVQFFSPKAQATTAAESYMKSLSSNNVSGATQLYPAEAPAENILQRNYKRVNITTVSDTYYLLYAFTDNQNPKMIRIMATHGKIKSVKSGSSIGATPSEDKSEDLGRTNQSQCLETSDLAYIDSTTVYARYIRGATMIFLPDSTDYKTSLGGNLLLDRMSDFYKKVPQKDFIFEIKGYRQSVKLSDEETTQFDDLFHRRAITLQNGLVARGVPLDRVVINDQYNYYIAEQATAVQNELYLDINIVNRCIKK